MLIAIVQYLTGYLKIRIEGYSPERFLNLCSHYGIYLWNLKPCSHAYEMNISVRGFRKLRPIIRKTRTKVTIRERRGFPFFIHKYRKRKIFFVGMLFCILSIYSMSLFVWNIHIEGNLVRTDEVILEFLNSKGITHGMRKSQVDCERIVEDIRKEYDDIIWVSAYVKGSRVMIQVKENADRKIQDVEETKGSDPVDIIADEDGTIEEIITRSGVPLVHKGDHVKKGDVLVSGTVEVLNDAKEVIGYQYQRADADIIAQTSLFYQDSMSLQYKEKQYTGKKKLAFWLETSEKIYYIVKSSNSYKYFTKETEVIRFKLGEHFWLPISFGAQTVREYNLKTKTYEKEAYQKKLSKNFREFCDDLEKKGVQILENNVKIYEEATQISAKGTVTLSKPLGIERQSEKSELPKINIADTAQQEGN